MKYRLKTLLIIPVVLLSGVVLSLVFSTVSSFYPGTGAVRPHTSERNAVAEVGDCRRAGPISDNGLGYWWECRVVVRVDDGRIVHTVVRRSIVTPNDAGRQVEFREACSNRTRTKCGYGRPASGAWALGLAVLNIVRRAITVAVVCISLFALVLGVLGVPRFYSLLDRGGGRRRRV